MTGETPNGWQERSVADLARVVGGSTPSSVRVEYWDGPIPFVTPTDLTSLAGRYLSTTERSITARGQEAAGLELLPPRSVLLATRASVGLAALNEVPVTTNQGFQNLVPRDGTDPLWLYYAISHRRRQLERLAAGTTFRELSRQSLRSLRLIVPPSHEQRAIAAILDSIDEALERTEAAIAATDDVRRAVLRDLLTHGLPGRHSEWTDRPGIGMIPACWSIARLGDLLVDIEAGRSPQCESRPAADGEWGVLKVSSVSWGEFRPDENKALPPSLAPDPELEVRPGDLLVSRSNTPELVGRTVLVEATRPRLLLSDKTLRLVPRRDLIDSSLLHLLLTTRWARVQIRAAATGSSGSMYNISQRALLSIPIPLPSVAERSLISDAAAALSEPIRAVRVELERLRLLKAATASALLTGHVRAQHA